MGADQPNFLSLLGRESQVLASSWLPSVLGDTEEANKAKSVQEIA